jgi:hypothetical protein
VSALSFELPEETLEALAERVREHAYPRFLSKKGLAEHYCVEPRTIKTWREQGLPGVRVGNIVMFEVEACDRWIEGQG